MNGPIVQACALTMFANQALRVGELPDIWPAASVFQFCKHVTFSDPVEGEGDAPVILPLALDPGAWLAWLIEQRVQGVRLLHQPSTDQKFEERKLAGMIGGGGRWFIETRRDGMADLWEAGWRVDHRDDPERKIWEVVYRRVLKDHPAVAMTDPATAERRQQLAELLPEIAAFAERQKLDAFAAGFRRAEAALAASSPLVASYHADLAHCRVLSPEAQQLLAAAQSAWVFGGMGSWNDLSFDGADQERYDELSERLYVTLIAAIVAASNSTLTAPVLPAANLPVPIAEAQPAAATVSPPRSKKSWWAGLFGRG